MSKPLSYNDQSRIGCAIDSNYVAGKIRNAESLLDDISEVDLMLLEDKKMAKKIAKLKKLMEQAGTLASEITTDFYNGIDRRVY
jgi:hypothetical protein